MGAPLTRAERLRRGVAELRRRADRHHTKQWKIGNELDALIGQAKQMAQEGRANDPIAQAIVSTLGEAKASCEAASGMAYDVFENLDNITRWMGAR